MFGSALGFRAVAAGGEISNPLANLEGTAGSWNTNADTSVTIPASSPGYIERTSSLDNLGNPNLSMVGFSNAANPPQTGWTTIQYVLYQTGTRVEVRLSGSGTITFTTAAIGSILRIERNASNQILFKVNGSTFYTISGVTMELKGDFVTGSPGDRIMDIWMERGNGPFRPFFVGVTNMTNF